MRASIIVSLLLILAIPVARQADPSDAAQESKPAAKQPSLAEIGPRPEPAKPLEPGAIDATLRRGVDFLLMNQNKDGSWGNSRLRGGVEIYAPIPGGHQAFHTAVTALSISALIETGGDSEQVRKSIQRGE